MLIESKNTKRTTEELQLVNQLKELSPQSEQRSAVRKELFAVLHKNYSVKELGKTPKALLELQHEDAFFKRQELLSEGIIRELKALNPEKRKEEIRDTPLNYLYNTFVSDTVNYFYRKKGLPTPDQQQATFTSEDYISQKNDVIDAMPFDLINLSDREVIELFSTFTSHVYDPSGMNPITYHHDAIAYIPELKQVLKQAKQIVLPGRVTSEKIIELPTPAGENMLLEFKYTTTAINIRKQQQKIRLRIHKPEYLKQVLNNDIENMEEKIKSLTALHTRRSVRYKNYHHNDDSDFRKKMSEDIVEQSIQNSSGSHIQDSVLRLENRKKGPEINVPAYKKFVEGLINNILKEIKSLIIKQKRNEDYYQNKGFSHISPKVDNER